MSHVGLIAAAGGQLDAFLKKKGVTRASSMSNGNSTMKSRQYGNGDKTSNWSSLGANAIYTNGNGVHC